MKTIAAWCAAFALYIVSAMALQSCATTKNAIVSCADQRLTQIEGNLLPGILAILESPNYEAALVGLAAQLGADGIEIVSCALNQILAPPPHASMLVSSVVAEHASDWLKAHGRSQ